MKPNSVVCAAVFFFVATSLSSCMNLFPNADEQSLQTAQSVAEAADPAAPMKKRIFIAQFINKSRRASEELTTEGNNVVKEFLQSHPELTVVPPEEMGGTDKFINEFNEYNLPLMYKKCRDHNVNGIVTGIIQDLTVRENSDDTGLFRERDFAVTATLKVAVLDVSTQREIMSKLTSADVTEQHVDFFNNHEWAVYDPERGKVAIDKALEKVRTIIPDYAKKVAWTGKIAKVDLQRFYVNAGETSGIARGTLLKVFGEPQNIFDPETKSLLGLAPGRFKGLLKVVDHFGIDGSVAIVHSGGGFKEKDRVEIFTSIQN